uniref:Uncharacterized protein n=1 Tax=Timema genevievae TaxID=629358 RepID=A0A7R9K663_TIMGE|nr:unnamed protein product [Timema genevievae]
MGPSHLLHLVAQISCGSSQNFWVFIIGTITVDKEIRNLREAQSRVEELEVSNSHLQRRLDKLKNAKSALLKEL